MKKFCRIFALLLVAVLLVSCGTGTKEFTCGDLTMTVPSYMRDVSGNADFSAFTFALDSTRIAVFGLEETYAEYPVLEDYTLEEYAELTLEANGLDVLAKERSTADYRYFDYTASVGTDTYRYLVGCYQTEDGFWTVQVCSLVTNFDLEAFLDYLDSVSFN